MAIGVQVTKDEVNSGIGILARGYFHTFLLADQLGDWYGGMLDADFTALGFSAGEIAQIRAFMDQSADLLKVWRGQATSATLPVNFRTAAKKAIGTGLY